jgi:hypothetical protein
VAEEHHPVARPDPARGERGGGPVDRYVEFRVRLAQVTVDNRRLFRVARGGPAEQVADRLAPGVCDEGRQVVRRARRKCRR